MVASDFSSLSQSINFLCFFGANNNESVLGRGGDFYKGLFWKNGPKSDFEENKSEIVKLYQAKPILDTIVKLYFIPSIVYKPFY
jgi:hypothetical protein